MSYLKKKYQQHRQRELAGFVVLQNVNSKDNAIKYMYSKILNMAKSTPPNPFSGMRIADTTFLKDVEGRSPCTVCGKSRKYFCYHCYVPVAELQGRLPSVKLPVSIDIIEHKNEIEGEKKNDLAIQRIDSVEDRTQRNRFKNRWIGPKRSILQKSDRFCPLLIMITTRSEPTGDHFFLKTNIRNNSS
ncbi:uncharacterized protein LOC129718998 isoform X3 [Wyeomyia smithii]|uniref:uncharacterized protein LOC129718998 isoform X3 n=1 Tax=Wyeomyia smithii TaxID=174621 RepID=UPI002467B23E|nr:uncharacterized protein LOC129718998 isoform X3 [Wyeomyia smithii]